VRHQSGTVDVVDVDLNADGAVVSVGAAVVAVDPALVTTIVGERSVSWIVFHATMPAASTEARRLRAGPSGPRPWGLKISPTATPMAAEPAVSTPSGTIGRLARPCERTLDDSGALDRLVQTALEDFSSCDFHWQLRDAVGSTWRQQHNIA
jgi:hypothetical protein